MIGLSRCGIQGLNPSRLSQETGKGMFAMDGVQNFLVLSLSAHGRVSHLGTGKFRKNELPCSLFFQGGKNGY